MDEVEPCVEFDYDTMLVMVFQDERDDSIVEAAAGHPDFPTSLSWKKRKLTGADSYV